MKYLKMDNFESSELIASLHLIQVPPRWVVPPVSGSALVGFLVALDYKATGHPPPAISWHRLEGGYLNEGLVNYAWCSRHETGYLYAISKY